MEYIWLQQPRNSSRTTCTTSLGTFLCKGKKAAQLLCSSDFKQECQLMQLVLQVQTWDRSTQSWAVVKHNSFLSLSLEWEIKWSLRAISSSDPELCWEITALSSKYSQTHRLDHSRQVHRKRNWEECWLQSPFKQITPVVLHEHISFLRSDSDFKQEGTSLQGDAFVEGAEDHPHSTRDALKECLTSWQCTQKPESPWETQGNWNHISLCLLRRENYRTDKVSTTLPAATAQLRKSLTDRASHADRPHSASWTSRKCFLLAQQCWDVSLSKSLCPSLTSLFSSPGKLQ